MDNELVNELVSTLGVTRANAIAFATKFKNDPGHNPQDLLVSFLGISKNNAKAFADHLNWLQYESEELYPKENYPDLTQGNSLIEPGQFSNDQFDETGIGSDEEVNGPVIDGDDSSNSEASPIPLTDEECDDASHAEDEANFQEDEKEYTGN